MSYSLSVCAVIFSAEVKAIVLSQSVSHYWNFYNPPSDPYSEALPTQASRKRTVFDLQLIERRGKDQGTMRHNIFNSSDISVILRSIVTRFPTASWGLLLLQQRLILMSNDITCLTVHHYRPVDLLYEMSFWLRRRHRMWHSMTSSKANWLQISAAYKKPRL